MEARNSFAFLAKHLLRIIFILNNLILFLNSLFRHRRAVGLHCGAFLGGTVGVWLGSSLAAQAFPPAPYYSLYGAVRDQVGQVIRAEGAELILLKGGKEIGRSPITSSQLDQSYELNLRIDQNRSGTVFYSDKAVAAQGLFSLVVSMNGALFYPIEVAGTLQAGKGGERVRLDLTLGEDADKDGLPDVWEQWQLY